MFQFIRQRCCGLEVHERLVKERLCYLEPDNQQLTEQQKQKIVNKHLKALEGLGYKSEIPVTASLNMA